MKRRILSCEGDMTLQENKAHEVLLVEQSTQPLGHELVNPYAVNKKSSLDLVELAQEIQLADSFVQATTCNKLKVIADQMRFLKQQAETVLLEAKRDFTLHHAACNLKKIPGKIYHLYQRTSGQKFFSIISPEEWGSSLTHDYLGSFRLEQDMSWTAVSDKEAMSTTNNIELLKKVLMLEQSSPKDDEQMMIDF